MPNRPSGKQLIGLALGGLVFVRLLMALIPVRLHIGPETTVIDSPLRTDGTPDYAAYLNDEWSVGVTPENNAAVELIRAFGAEIIDEEVRQKYFERLGIAVSEDPALFVEFRDYVFAEGIAERHDTDRLFELEEAAALCQSGPWNANDCPEVAAWLDAQEPALAAFLDASERPRFFSPLVRRVDGNLFAVRMPVVQHSRSAARLLITQAMLELGRRNVERACELTLACHRLSRLLSEHPTMIAQFVSYAFVAIANAGDQAIVLSGQLTQDQAIAYRKELGALPPLRPMSKAINRSERFNALDMTITTYAGRKSMRWMFDPNPVLRQFNAAYDEIGAALALQDHRNRDLALADIDQRHSNVERPAIWEYGLAMAVGHRAMVSKHVGQVLVSLGLSSSLHAIHAEEQAHVRMLLADIGYALVAYNAGHSAFPDSLDALVPSLIPAVPLDPFTGDLLKYELKEDGFLLYSLGDNGLDDGGLRDGSTNADDIAFGVTPEPDDGD